MGFAGQDSVEESVADAGRSVHDVQGRLEIQFSLFRAEWTAGSSSVTHPVSTAFMKNPKLSQVGRGSARKHVQRGLGHVGVRVPVGLHVTGELAFHGRYIDNMFLSVFSQFHHGRELIAEDKRSDGAYELELDEFRGRDFAQTKTPAIVLPQVHLLKVCVQDPAGNIFSGAKVGRGCMESAKVLLKPKYRSLLPCGAPPPYFRRRTFARRAVSLARTFLQSSNGRSEILHRRGQFLVRGSFGRISDARKSGRPADSLRRIVDENVEPGVFLTDEITEKFYAGCVAEV